MSEKATSPERTEVPAKHDPTFTDWFDRWPESLQGISA